MLDIPEQSLVKYYNKDIRGVDRMYQNIAYYFNSVSLEKIVGNIFYIYAKCCCSKSWLSQKKSTLHEDKPLDVLGFQREIVNMYRMKYSTQQRPIIRSPHETTLFKRRSNQNYVPAAV